ncbi:MAG: TetR/AcrR family transcriptional regulator [Chloroflexota bacterium]
MTHPAGEKQDLRVLRTHIQLQRAFIELTVEKGFGAVTVSDITERAMVNRSTFYRHFLDKYDLLDNYMNWVDDTVTADDFAMDKLGSSGKPTGLIRLLEHVQKFADFYRVMLGQKGDPVFTERFRQYSMKRYRFLLSNAELQEPPNSPPVELKLNYISCAGVGAIMWWLENGQPCTVEQLATWLSQLSMSSVGIPPKMIGDLKSS